VAPFGIHTTIGKGFLLLMHPDLKAAISGLNSAARALAARCVLAVPFVIHEWCQPWRKVETTNEPRPPNAPNSRLLHGSPTRRR
jgi:hypothetical protein